MPQLPMDYLEGPLILLRLSALGQYQFGLTLQNRQGRPHLMRGVRHELPQLLNGRNYARKELIECRRKTPKLVARVGNELRAFQLYLARCGDRPRESRGMFCQFGDGRQTSS